MDIDGKPQWVMMGVGTRRGVRVYASRELTRASIPVMEHGPGYETPLITMQATGRNVLIIDGPDYPWVLARIQAIWQNNPLPDLDAGPGWGHGYEPPPRKVQRAERLDAERIDRRRLAAERMLPRYPAPDQPIHVELGTGVPVLPQISYTEQQEYRRPGLPIHGYSPPPALPPRPAAPQPASEPLAIEAPRTDGDDG